jgi:peptidoglycan/xylan/chitin deacetylase (PgdA/CDA1 family)
MTIGAHTHTHPDLRDLSEERVRYEIETSDAIIEEKTGVRPRHFAYPKGYWSATAEPVIRSTYESAVLGAGEPFTASTDPHRICRVPVQLADGSWLFRRKLDSGMRLEEMVRSRLKGYENPPSAKVSAGRADDV